ncbi:MAG: aldo/keto reductase [Caldilineaceae bacterium]|nr:aldo/keto reductase [Caldilineaceae bacterium]
MTAIKAVPLGGKNSLQVTNFGLGTAPIGHARNVSDGAADATIQRAYELGVRLFDSAPLYGNGEAEIRVGRALQGIPRTSYVISTKIGRVLNADRSAFVYDYSRDGVMRSIEGSLKRLNTDRLDIVLVHDPDADVVDHEQDALDGAFPTLQELRSQGVIKALGAGMNQWQMEERFAEQADPDVFLLAGRYTLLEQTSLAFLKRCKEKGIGIFLGGVYNSGILATGPHEAAQYNYANAPAAILEKARQIKAITDRYDVGLNVAALHFALAHPTVTSLVVGAVKPREVEANIAALKADVPAKLWQELQDAGLIEQAAPLPS